jgi:hypothetical protein
MASLWTEQERKTRLRRMRGWRQLELSLSGGIRLLRKKTGCVENFGWKLTMIGYTITCFPKTAIHALRDNALSVQALSSLDHYTPLSTPSQPRLPLIFLNVPSSYCLRVLHHILQQKRSKSQSAKRHQRRILSRRARELRRRRRPSRTGHHASAHAANRWLGAVAGCA